MILMNSVKKQYNDFTLDVSLHIPIGRISGIVGKNGAGKSTTIKLILGLIKSNSGSIQLLGKDIKDIKPVDKCDIGVCLAESGFSLELNGNDILCILKKMYPKFDQAFFESKCRSLNIPMNKKLREFSTGMKAKLRVLVAISHDAKLLILDEPTAGLDVEARNEILDLLRDYISKDESRSILITSHISSDLESLCDDIYLIHDGKVIVHEDIDTILEQYAILKVNNDQYSSLDKEYIIKSQKMNYGYACFTNEKRFYKENYADIVIEDSGIDDLILMMTGGYR